MSLPIEPAAEDELQFKTAEPVVAQRIAPAPASQICARCRKPLTSEYYAVGKYAVCADCRSLLAPQPTGSRFGRLLKAGLFGLGAGLAGAVLWYVVRKVTNMEIGLIAVVVGYMVGKAVRRGSGNRGGPSYQVMAVLLTYCCIAANYMPDVAQALIEDLHNKSALSSDDGAVASPASPSSTVKSSPSTASPTTHVVNHTTANAAEAATPKHERPSLIKVVGAVILLVAIVFGLSLAAPFLMGVQNILGLLIIGFALWEAWKFNRRIPLAITGPYRLGNRSNGQNTGT